MRKIVNKYRFWQAVLVLIFCISTGLLVYQMVYMPMKNREAAERLKDEFPEENLPPGGSAYSKERPPAGKEKGIPSVDLAALREKYPDVQGWLTIPGTNIDYPVLQSGEDSPEYYLKRNYKGERDANGSLFLQWNCKVPESRNLIIYGHNMNSGAMFGNLDDFTNAGYCKEHAGIFFQTMEGVAEYRIVSVMKADIRMFPFRQADFSEAGGLQDYVIRAKGLGMFEKGEDTEVMEADQVLTLVTCSYEWKDARNIIVAVKTGMAD